MRGFWIFSREGGAGRPVGQKIVWTTSFLVLNLCNSLQRGANGFIAEKTITIERIQRGSNIFQGGGGATFSREGGSKC